MGIPVIILTMFRIMLTNHMFITALFSLISQQTISCPLATANVKKNILQVIPFLSFLVHWTCCLVMQQCLFVFSIFNFHKTCCPLTCLVRNPHALHPIQGHLQRCIHIYTQFNQLIGKPHQSEDYKKGDGGGNPVMHITGLTCFQSSLFLRDRNLLKSKLKPVFLLSVLSEMSFLRSWFVLS